MTALIPINIGIRQVLLSQTSLFQLSIIRERQCKTSDRFSGVELSTVHIFFLSSTDFSCSKPESAAKSGFFPFLAQTRQTLETWKLKSTSAPQHPLVGVHTPAKVCPPLRSVISLLTGVGPVNFALMHSSPQILSVFPSRLGIVYAEDRTAFCSSAIMPALEECYWQNRPWCLHVNNNGRNDRDVHGYISDVHEYISRPLAALQTCADLLRSTLKGSIACHVFFLQTLLPSKSACLMCSSHPVQYLRRRFVRS